MPKPLTVHVDFSQIEAALDMADAEMSWVPRTLAERVERMFEGMEGVSMVLNDSETVRAADGSACIFVTPGAVLCELLRTLRSYDADALAAFADRQERVIRIRRRARLRDPRTYARAYGRTDDA